MTRVFYIIILALLPIVSHAQSIADLARKAETEKNPLSKYSITGSCHNGLYIVSNEEIVLSNDGDPVLLHVYGVVNDGGIVYIPKEYEQLELIKEGSTYEDNVYKCKKKGKWGLVNSTNSTLLSCEYNNLTNIGNNIWRTSKSGKYGYVRLNTTSNVTTLIDRKSVV